MTDRRTRIGERFPVASASYDEDFLRWLVGVSHATLRDAEATLVVPGALLGVTVFILAMNLDTFVPDGSGWAAWIVWALLIGAILMALSGAATLLAIFSGALAAELRDRYVTRQNMDSEADLSFISQAATRRGSERLRCQELTYYREVLDYAAEYVVRNRGPAYARILLSAGLLLLAGFVATLGV